MIRIDAVWLATEPMDMRAGTDTALARVVKVFGAARPHQAYLFANRRANRMKVLVIDGIGIWLAARRLHQGHFLWPAPGAAAQMSLSRAQLDGLVLGLPWARIGEGGIITLV
ncbi:IS66 family insertion sequence element accessory protein TnpB [Rhodoferax sp.]|uniref:IS66 family insertion sequence element accessory protein TnpB n=1 Tax=Rhodoferax sp. TaxID=50421 RepID=UPI00276F5520|nr:IS66 family insertion sequence element accessory protein TnpB [Rhodoferax sp.]